MASLLPSVIIGLLIGLARNITLILFLWLIYIFLEEVWSGLGKFISIIFFPGKLLKQSEQFALARLLGANVKHITMYRFLTSSSRSRVYIDFPEGRVGRAIIVIITPTIFNLVLATLLSVIINIIDEYYLVILVSWLIVSLVITGLPCKEDLAFVFNNLVTGDATILFYYVWGLVGGVLIYLAFGPQVTVFALLLYYLVITISLVFVSSSTSANYDIVFDEDELID